VLYGVEPICRVLTEHGMPVEPSTYYEAIGRSPSQQAVRDERLAHEVVRVHQAD
jgi:putative transposase